ncbi:MAG: T9SS type A sorting domain-containing protein [Cyclobacteriaceae bacterium]
MKQFLLIISLCFLFGTIQAQSTGSEGEVLSSETTAFDNQELELKNVVEFFPNPAVDYLNVEIRNSDLVKVEFEVYDIIGNRIKVNPEKITKDKFRISVSELHVGYYMLIVKDPYSRFKVGRRFGKGPGR